MSIPLLLLLLLLPLPVAAATPSLGVMKDDPHKLVVMTASQRFEKVHQGREAALYVAKTLRTQLQTKKRFIAMQITDRGRHGTAWIQAASILSVMVIKHEAKVERVSTTATPKEKSWLSFLD